MNDLSDIKLFERRLDEELARLQSPKFDGEGCIGCSVFCAGAARLLGRHNVASQLEVSTITQTRVNPVKTAA